MPFRNMFLVPKVIVSHVVFYGAFSSCCLSIRLTYRRANQAVFSDRFGLQTVINRRRALLAEKVVVKYPTQEPTDEPPKLDEAVYTEKITGKDPLAVS